MVVAWGRGEAVKVGQNAFDSDNILKVELMALANRFDKGKRKESRVTPGFWPEQLKGWNCSKLG